MALVFKCDRCERLYGDTTNDRYITDTAKGCTITIALMDDNDWNMPMGFANRYERPLELCKTCSDKLKNWLQQKQ